MNKLYSILVYIVSSTCLYAQVSAKVQGVGNLNAEIEKLKNDSDLSHASWGICVMRTKTGETITQYNDNISLTPASTLKAVTTAAGLSILGSDYTYQTTLEYDGVYDSINGIIKGNLYIKGSGDPTIESQYFKNKDTPTPLTQKWAEELKAKGIKKIEGAIIADASAFEFETVPSTWIWGDMGNYYGAGASGLSYMDNMYTLYFKSGKSGDTTSITKTEPELLNLRINNYVKANGSDDNAYIYGAPYSYERYVTGTIPPYKTDFDVKGSMPDPPYFFAYQLSQSLLNSGVEVVHSPTSLRILQLNNSYRPQARKKLLIYTSPTLDKIVYFTNLNSNNLFAEHILKTIALKIQGRGSENTGTDEVLKFWKAKGINTGGMYMQDGCGLSRGNSITPNQLASVFRLMTLDSAYTSFYNSLPVAGKTGTMVRLCKGTFAENNLRAKTGSLSRVRSFAGYVTTKNEEQLCFSIIVNNYDCSSAEIRKKLERLMVLIAEIN